MKLAYVIGSYAPHLAPSKLEVKADNPFEWTRSQTLAIAYARCSTCFGLGLRMGRAGTLCPCPCVLRNIFRCVYRKFMSLAAKLPNVRSAIDHCLSAAQHAPRRYGFRNQEFCADFISISKRVLGTDTVLARIFRYHYLLGADFLTVNRKLGRRPDDRSTFHDFYRIEVALGRAFREIAPYSLFPVNEYMGTVIKGRTCALAAA